MPTITPEYLVLTFMVIFVAGMVNARPKIGRRFCAHYPFAPRCLGVAAKRDGEEANKMANGGLPDYGDIASLVLRSKSDIDDSPVDDWDSHEGTDDVSKAVIVPLGVLSKILGTKPAAALNKAQKRRLDMWLDYDTGRE
ncbi:uncharacterized protein LOC110445806 [Mizuhopecten yessoensis]|uniref:Elevenin n=1 Tax=Mizuhopecten yessoensis TaxID=6573 RepID=A0A210R6A6_MIZYE|nr:uncharacterized protein LOC110445806 [Mizuhopecten yessoensis]AXN93483.1 elevenin [Mizuhopecten yessoensis]OWF56593.1 hypothetical protein KP79_PYT18695 [Mizuhopecten yessoensis]